MSIWDGLHLPAPGIWRLRMTKQEWESRPKRPYTEREREIFKAIARDTWGIEIDDKFFDRTPPE